MSTTDYIRALVDPFDTLFAQPKLLDGSETRSAGVRFRHVGNVTLPSDGTPQYFILFPGYSYGLCWKTTSGSSTLHTINPSHLGSLALRSDIRKVRLVSTGLKLSLENTSDDNEGNWEAIRMPMSITDFELTDNVIQTSEDFGVRVKASFSQENMANHSTYQTGRLRDIHRFMFKLNSTDPDHDWSDVHVLTGTVDPAWDLTTTGLAIGPRKELLDQAFDVVVIKVNGRVDPTIPSVLRYDLVSNQEVVYRDGTALGRLMSNNIMIPQMDVILDRTRFQLPSIQII